MLKGVDNMEIGYTLKEVTKILGLKSEETVRRYIRSGEMKATLFKNKYYINSDNLNEFISKNTKQVNQMEE